jgi:hypothetical protein
MNQPKIDGHPVRMAGQDWILAPLNFRQLRVTLKQAFVDLQSSDTEARFNAFEQIVHASLSRNYPDLTIEQVEEMLDMSNVMEVVDAVMNISGMARRAAGGTPDATDPSIGTPFTGTSSPPSDGAGSTSMSP